MFRVGAVSYLNTKPLIAGLDQRLGNQGKLSLNLPSRLASQLRNGELDVALIPSVEYFRNQHLYEVVSDAAIACRGPVWSVRLLSRVPAVKIRSLALDEGSRTSAALVQVLLHEIHGIRPKTTPLTIESDPEFSETDATLLIGDRAMHPAPGMYQEIWDLGDRWCRWTELPFVFAMWVARRDWLSRADVDGDSLASILEASRDQGLANLEQISAKEAAGHGLTNEDVHRYFAENLHFKLGAGEWNGLRSFRQKAEAIGLVSPTSTHSLND